MPTIQSNYTEEQAKLVLNALLHYKQAVIGTVRQQCNEIITDLAKTLNAGIPANIAAMDKAKSSVKLATSQSAPTATSNKRVYHLNEKAPRWTDDTIMPFGKHKGKKLGSIDEKYLEWLHDQGCTTPGLKEYLELLFD